MPSAACRDEDAVVKPTWIVLIGAAAFATACTSPPAHEADRRAPAPAATAAAEMTALASSFEAGGVVRARVTALVASRVMAPIVDMRVKAGDRVHRGDVLVTLDARDLRANDARAQAATLSAAESVRAAEADVRATASAAQLAHLTHDRVATLQAKRSATTEELDQAVAALSAAEAQQAAAQARLSAATAGHDAAKAAADAAAVTATYATLTAPFDGIVTERSAEPGSMAAPGSPLLTLEDPTTYRLEARLDETRAAQVSLGRDATIQLDDRDASMTGRVVEIARVDPTSHTFLVKLELPGGMTARSGQFGRATFAGPSRRALTIPASALIRRGQLTFVFVLGSDERAHLQPVSIGAMAGDRVEVFAGVRESDRIVTSPEPSINDGAAIARTRP
jgi:multidrug efflux pump subunit AcrA (membrane-fusion protein)